MSNAEEVKLMIKAVINEEKNKVLFAEAGSDFTDVLFSFLLLPLATIMRLLKRHYGRKVPVIGSLSTFYNGVPNLDSLHFPTEAVKNMLLNPTSCYEREFCKLRLNVSSIKSKSVSDCGETYGGVLTDGAASFIIGDDLRVMPNVTGSILKTLSNLGIAVTDMDGAETRVLTLGLNEIMSLLKGSLFYRNYSNSLYSNEFYPLNFDPTITVEHVKGSRMYMVSDDLTVTPLGMTSSFAVLNGMDISLSDIEELKLQVGLEEGLSILKAALTSTAALTNGLINPMMKQPKQEN